MNTHRERVQGRSNGSGVPESSVDRSVDCRLQAGPKAVRGTVIFVSTRLELRCTHCGVRAKVEI